MICAKSYSCYSSKLGCYSANTAGIPQRVGLHFLRGAIPSRGNMSMNAITATLNASAAMPANMLAGVAMLVSFNASVWTARKIDKAKGQELTEANQAKDKSAIVAKKLLVENATLILINQTVTRAREDHKRLTLPWLDNGTRILPAAMHDQYMETMAKHESVFWPLVETLVRNYPEYVEQAALKHLALGELFNRQDYPSITAIKNKFDWHVKRFTIPSGDDFRVNLSANVVKRIQAEMTASLNEATTNAIHSVFERAHECVARVVESLNGYDPNKPAGERGGFHKTMISQIEDLIGIMPALNLTNDPRINQLASDMAALTQFSAKELRESDNIRQGVATKAAAIASAVADFMA